VNPSVDKKNIWVGLKPLFNTTPLDESVRTYASEFNVNQVVYYQYIYNTTGDIFRIVSAIDSGNNQAYYESPLITSAGLNSIPYTANRTPYDLIIKKLI
jgi:hypothetical protein